MREPGNQHFVNIPFGVGVCAAVRLRFLERILNRSIIKGFRHPPGQCPEDLRARSGRKFSANKGTGREDAELKQHPPGQCPEDLRARSGRKFSADKGTGREDAELKKEEGK